MNQLHDECREWLQKAGSDLASARILIGNKEPVFDTACFHCHQTVEKVLKAYLAYKSVRFEKVHSLSYLLDVCADTDDEFSQIRDEAEILEPYAVEIRYPGIPADISMSEAEEALRGAESITEFTLQRLPEGLRSVINL
jgi:HEPN domain-containing protein